MKNRYFISLILSLFIYSTLIASSLYFLSENSISKSSKESSETIQRVKVSLVEPKTPPPIKKRKEKITKPTIKKKEKVQKPKPLKKVVKKKIEKVVKKKIVKKEIKKEIKKPLKQNLTTQNTTSKTIIKDKNIEAKKIKELQNVYFAKISETINKNKSYPRRALLRNLQDDIKIEFILSPKGELLSFFILHGKKIFHNSAQKAIKKSFPITPPKGALTSNTKVKLTLAYRLN